MKDISNLTEEQILIIFERMEKGVIKTLHGKIFSSVDSYQSTFKCFWNWLMRSRRKQGITIPDVTPDIIVQKKLPEFVHFTKDDLTAMSKIAKQNYRVLMWFLFDSGVRPQELKNLLVSDISKDSNGVVSLNVRASIAKKGSFGRKIKLLLCNNLILDWIKTRNSDDPLFDISDRVVNQNLKRLAMKVLGKKITLYDFRHNSCCYWINIYKKDQALKYRFGWKKSEMIEYYSRYIGLKDDLTENDLLDDEARTKIEKELETVRKQVALQDEQYRSQIEELKQVLKDQLMREILAEMKY